MALRRVFEPIMIGKVEIPNRIARTAHAARLTPVYIDDSLIAYHTAGARGGGGCGLTILGTAEVDASSVLGNGTPGNSIADDRIFLAAAS